MKFTHARILVTALMLCAAFPAQAQLDRSGLFSATSVQATTSNFFFAKPNEVTITVNVIGSVQRPGRYEISQSIDLVNLISLAGGPMPDGSMGDVKITRIVDNAGRPSWKELHFDLEDVSRLAAGDMALSPGDIIQVGRSGWSQFRDTFNVILGVAVLTTAVVQIVQISKK